MAYQDLIKRLVAERVKNAVHRKATNKLSSLGINITKRPTGPRSIDQFKSLLSKGNGMARVARYEVVLTPPAGMTAEMGSINISGATRDLNLMCDTITMPGHDIQTQTRQFGSEPASHLSTSHGFEGTIESTFYMSENMREKSYFNLWQEMAVHQDTHKARYYKTILPDGRSFDNYAGKMKIFQLGGKGRTAGIEVEGVFPEKIGQIEYAYATVDTLTLLPVSFQYRSWKTIHPDKLNEM